MKINKIVKVVILILIVIVCIRFSLIIVNNTALNFIKSEKFHDFLINRIELHLIKLSNEIENNERDEIINAIKKIQRNINSK